MAPPTIIMADNRPPVYEENGIMVYRASALGMCVRALVAMGRDGYDEALSKDRKELLERSAEEGDVHEGAVREKLVREGYKIVSTQDEVEIEVMKGVIIRGHTDGILTPPDGVGDVLLEVKTMSNKVFARWIKGGFDSQPKYAFQISSYMQANPGLDVLYYAKRREDGFDDRRIISAKNPPVDFKVIRKKILTAEGHRRKRASFPQCDLGKQDQWWCLTAGHLVLTENGYQPIEDVVIGTKVLTHKGRWRRVVGKSERLANNLREVKAMGTTLTTTDEHKILVRERYYKHTKSGQSAERLFSDPQWVEAQKLLPDHFGMQVLPPTTNEWDHLPPEYWWMVGRWLGDGWNDDWPSGSRICCGHDEYEDLADGLRRAGVDFNAHKHRTTWVFRLKGSDALGSSKERHGFLSQFGQGAKNKRLPGFVFGLPQESATELLRGYLSADGHLLNTGIQFPRWAGSSVSKELAIGIVLLAQRVWGVVGSTYPGRKGGKSTIEGRSVTTLPDWIIQIPLRQKRSRGFVDGIYGLKPIFESTPLTGEAIVYDLKVEEDESFLVDNMVVHNCPLWYLHDEANPDDVTEMSDEDQAVLATIIPDRMKLKEIEDAGKEAESQRKALDKEILNLMGGTDKTIIEIDGDDYQITQVNGGGTNWDHAKLQSDLGEEVLKYQSSYRYKYPKITKKKKQPKMKGTT